MRCRVAAAVLLVLLLGLALGVGLPRMQARAKRETCLFNAKRVALAVWMYASDYDEVFPPSKDWLDTTITTVRLGSRARGLREPRIDPVCPAARDKRCGYAYNRALASRSSGSMWRAGGEAAARRTVVIFESDLGWNAVGGRTDLPARPRHSGGDCFGFLDGHSKWLPRSEQRGLVWEPRIQELPPAPARTPR